MKIISTFFTDVLLLELDVYADQRGEFAEIFAQHSYAEAGVTAPFVQDNWSCSVQGVVRGLHIQRNFPQGKLVTVCQGHILDVVVDVNPVSPSFGKHIAVDLFGFDQHEKVCQLWIPPGYAHGFAVLSKTASVFYKCTQRYYPEDEGSILWCDTDLAIDWRVSNPIVSAKDQRALTLQQWIQQ